MSEPQFRFELDLLEWATTKYPLMVVLALKYLGISAASVSFERCLSTVGIIVTAKRSVWRA